MRIYLVGFMGSGKTYLGRQLASRLGFQFFDLDQEMERQTGKTISQIFEEEGETFFRNLEASSLRLTEKLSNCIIATGGGAPCFFQNMAWMNDHGITIYLQAKPDLLARRLENEAHQRPLLEGKNGQPLLDLIEKKLVERVGFYEQAHLSLEILDDGEEAEEELAKYLWRFVKI